MPLRVDHVQPVALGGRDVPENLVTACFDCNSGKSSVPVDAAIVADVAADALRWKAAMLEAQEEAWDEICAEHESNEEFRSEWNTWTDPTGRPCPLPGDWEASLTSLRRAGLWGEIIHLSIETAMVGPAATADKWRYFCGVCWRKVEQLTARTQELAEQMP